MESVDGDALSDAAFQKDQGGFLVMIFGVPGIPLT